MAIPTRILVPVDFSPSSDHALDFAVALAAALDATVFLLNVIAVPTFGIEEIGIALTSSVMADLVRTNQAAVDDLVEARKDRAKLAAGMLRTGDPRDTIVQVAHEIGADLIVMGTHGRRGLTRALLGSVAEAIVRTSPIPVVTLRLVKG